MTGPPTGGSGGSDGGSTGPGRLPARIGRLVAELVRDFGTAIDLMTSGRAGTAPARDSAQLPAEGRTG